MQATKSQVLTTAEAVAQYLLNFPNATGVFLFGSVARDGDGRDIDMIVTVPDDVFTHYIKKFRFDEDFYFEGGGTRFARACVELGFDEQLLELLNGTRIDLFLLPQNWRAQLEPLQTMFPHRDPDFMVHIAADARHFNRVAGQFDGHMAFEPEYAAPQPGPGPLQHD